MDRKRLLVYLPADLVERANREVASPETATPRLNELITEALGQYLDELEDATESRKDTRTERTPDTPSPPSLGNDEPGSPRAFSSAKPPHDPFSEMDPRLADALMETNGVYRYLTSLLDQDLSSARKVAERTPEGERFKKAREKVLEATRIEATDCPTLDPDGEVGDSDIEQPLFGLHNRDYTSLWGLQLLARVTQEGPVYWSQFAFGLDLVARSFREMVAPLDHIRLAGEEPRSGLRYGSGFPKPPPGPETGEGRVAGQWLHSVSGTKRNRISQFVRNNVARVQRSSNPEFLFDTRGPLPAWQAITFRPEGQDFLVGVSKQGLDLLRAVAGISLDLPHSREKATAFFKYLARYAPGDSNGFRKVLGAISAKPTREELIEANQDFFVASSRQTSLRGRGPNNPERYSWTMTQGYVARGREWGLVESSLARTGDGKSKGYALTEAGDHVLELLSSG